MRAVVQRVKKASVTVDGKIVGSIERGLMVLLGIHEKDTINELLWMAEKLVKLRIFEDEEGKMNISVKDIGGDILLVSQFTLYGDLKKGTRPSYIEAARPEVAIPLYEKMIETLKNEGLRVETGVFGAMMDVELINSGPVTIILER
jgi:D-tyrosyl-tRNA(Tyr) deacylase